jgi:hypothetical protein
MVTWTKSREAHNTNCSYSKTSCIKLTLYSYVKHKINLNLPLGKITQTLLVLFSSTRMSHLQRKPGDKTSGLDLNYSGLSCMEGLTAHLPPPPGPPSVSTTSWRSLLPRSGSDLTAFAGKPPRRACWAQSGSTKPVACGTARAWTGMACASSGRCWGGMAELVRIWWCTAGLGAVTPGPWDGKLQEKTGKPCM